MSELNESPAAPATDMPDPESLRVPTLDEIMALLIKNAASKGEISQCSPEMPTRFPVVVRPETRRVLNAIVDSTGGSLAGIVGAIVDGVILATMQANAK